MRAVATLPFLLVLAAPALAASEAGEAHGPSFGMLALHALNFAFMLWLLNRYARRPLLDYLAQRSQGIREELDSAQARLLEAEQELDALRTRLAAFDGEAERILATAEQVAQSEKQHAVERARETADRLREDAQRVVQQEIARARTELRAEAANLSTRLAGELLRDKLEPEDDKRLVKEFVDRIGEAL
jgi:F-type H+-transporting ATPase subunit b